MKVLWSVFVTFPEVEKYVNRKAEYACTWVRALANKLRVRNDIQLAIVSVWDGDKIQKYDVDNLSFYFLPNRKNVMRNGGGSNTRIAWQKIIDDFNPEVIHIHGTESLVPYELIKLKPNIPIYATLQGVLTSYYQHEYGGIDMKDIVFNTTLRDVVRRSGIIMDKRKTAKKMKYEQEMLKNIQYVGGRTLWDKTAVLKINPNIEYLNAPELIRPEFYKSTRWCVNDIKRHRIFMHQGFKPIKGFHFMIEALNILKRKYPDIELYMSGTNIMKDETIKNQLLQTGYAKYLKKLIAKYGLEDCIHFTGIIDAAEIVNELKLSNVMVLPSAIENSPNSLCEAQLVGVPCVASFVGGVPELLKDRVEGLLYCYNEPTMLAEYISQIFESDELAEEFSKASYKRMRQLLSEEAVVSTTIENYKEVIRRYEVNINV
jgi:L-malate glycosyltransferase